MPLYRKLPVVIEARQLPNDCAEMREIAEWAGGEFVPGVAAHVLIPTPDGALIVNVGDWVVLDVDGTFRLCWNDVFINTYELVHP